jgi:hypothetical protein
LTQIEELIADQQEVLGTNHPSTLQSRRWLAEHLGWAVSAQRAVTDFEELLEIMLNVLGPGHELTLGTRRSLGDWKTEAGDIQGALHEFTVLHQEMEPIFGSTHHHVEIVANRIRSLARRVDET